MKKRTKYFIWSAVSFFAVPVVAMLVFWWVVLLGGRFDAHFYEGYRIFWAVMGVIASAFLSIVGVIEGANE